jgi:uncharacterized membrane protein HdeD (DUF308 family)
MTTVSPSRRDGQGPPSLADPVIRDLVGRVAKYWWVLLILGAFWIVIALVILKFTHASVTTVGILIGIMFLVASAQEFMLAVLDRRWWRWLWALFGVFLFVGAILAFIHPQSTFAALADILGFVFLLIGAFWIAQAFAERPVSETWWLTLTAGILMVVLAFWTEGEFFLEKAATLLVFAGIWALMHGITDIIRAFQIRRYASD